MTPEEVESVTDEYRREMDPVAEFIASCCVEGADEKVTAGGLYKAYLTWCSANCEPTISQNALGRQLKERSFRRRNGTRGVRIWVGLGLKPDLTEDTADDDVGGKAA